MDGISHWKLLTVLHDPFLFDFHAAHRHEFLAMDN